MIEDLGEPVKKETKYKIGQEIWYLNWSKNICSATIKSIEKIDE